MREIRISKGNGKFRLVYEPGRGERRRLDAILPALMAAERVAAIALEVEGVAHGFVAGRSPVTCARAHTGLAVSVSAATWPGGSTRFAPSRFVPAWPSRGQTWRLAEKVCHLARPARQGLPTSPAAANLAAVPMDRAILDDLRDTLPGGVRCVYIAATPTMKSLTVSLSVDGPAAVAQVQTILARCAARMGWAIAAHKTKVQRAKGGRRVIVGVSVGDAPRQVQAPRWQRRRLRAARHQGADRPQALGLAEWCSMKLHRRGCAPRGASPARCSPRHWQPLTMPPPWHG